MTKRPRPFLSVFRTVILVFLVTLGGIGIVSGQDLPMVMSINGPDIGEFVNSPGPFTFTVTLSGGTPPYTYVWKKTSTPRMTADVFKCSQGNSVTVPKEHFTSFGGLYLEVTDAKGHMATWVNGDGQTMVVFSQYYGQTDLRVLPICNIDRQSGDAWVTAKTVNGVCYSRTQLPALPATPSNTVVQNQPACAPPPEDSSWVVIVGGLAAVAVAAAVIARILKNRPKKKGEQPPEQYILQLSKDTLKVSPEKSDSFTASVWKVTEAGGLVPVPTATIQVTAPPGVPGLSIAPTSGTGSLTPVVSLSRSPGAASARMGVTASDRGGSVSAQVTVTFEEEAAIEFD
ncbi:MAG TPA: hypothetical protein HA256_03700 [Methanoregulaceae archaeon]|jgi:hypothetical protein|nr:hypothetical protein [Methanoregulaceae archaeon]